MQIKDNHEYGRIFLRSKKCALILCDKMILQGIAAMFGAPKCLK
jgi:hypothetical protein